MKPPLRLLAVPLATAALAFSGCGSNTAPATGESATDGTTSGQPAANGADRNGQAAGRTVSIAADPGGGLRYEPDELDAAAGRITVRFTNDSPIPHDIVFQGPDDREAGRTSVFTGGSEDASFKAKPGAYTFYCSVPGHREAGMEGTLTVE